jgi:hypothetical protein
VGGGKKKWKRADCWANFGWEKGKRPKACLVYNKTFLFYKPIFYFTNYFELKPNFEIRMILIAILNLIAHNNTKEKLCNGMNCNKQLYNN